MDIEETDKRVRDLYARNAAPVDMEKFSASLRRRLARTRGRRRWTPGLAESSRAATDGVTHRVPTSSPRRPGRLRVAVYSGIAVVLVAAITLGTLEALEYLGKDQSLLVITDDSLGMSPGSTGPTDQTSSTVSTTGGAAATTQASTSTSTAPARAAALVWKFQAGGPVYDPVIADGVVYFGSADGLLYAVDAENGTEIWKFRTDGPITTSPAVSDGIAYAGSWDGCLYAVDVKDGAEKWKFQTGGQIAGGVALSEGVAYVGSSDGLLHAVDTKDGREIWTFRAFGQITASPVIADGVVFVGSWGDPDNLDEEGRGYDSSGSFYAVDADNGTEVWSFRPSTPGSEIIASAAVHQGAVLFATYDDPGELYAVDAETGVEKWKSSTVPVVCSEPVISDGMIYLTSGGGWLYALDSNGESVWSFQTNDQISTFNSPAVSDGVVYFGNNGGFVFAVDAQTGAEMWEFETGDAVRSAPAVSGGVVYVGSDDGYLYALR